MSSLDEAFSRQFRAWEMRGRGGRLFDQPVALEPPFVPFLGYDTPRQRVDDGRRATMLSRFWDTLTAPSAEPSLPPEQITEPGPYYRSAEPCAELQLTLPESSPLPAATHLGWMHEICRAGEPLTFELLGTPGEIVPQFAGKHEAMERIHRALPQYLPKIMMLPQADALHSAWFESAPRFASVTLGLGCEFMIPLRPGPTDLLSTVVHAMDGLRDRELALYQILIEPVVNQWAECIAPALTAADGKPIFRNRPELVSGAERKLAAPFLAVVVRLAACAETTERCWDIILDMAGPFAALTQRGSNYLIPLSNDGYAPVDQEEDLLSRTSHRTGMLLNAEELVPLISLPTGVSSRHLRRVTTTTRPAPIELLQGGSLLLGKNSHGGRTANVWLSPSERVRHMHVLGTSGTGKSTLLLNLIRQDLETGEGFAVLDPHGDLIDSVLGLIPPTRVEDVVLVDPSDEEFVVGFNILAAHSDLERNLLASDLVSVFRRLSTSWGEQMNSVLRNAILAFLESSRGGTLADLRRFLLDRAYREDFLGTVTDPEIVFYWRQAFPQLTGNRSIGPVLTRLDEFLSRKPIRYMVSQQENRLNFSEILDQGRILLVKLSQGQLGRENANLLGSVIMSKIQQTAMSRQLMPASQRRDFWVYLDEFHSFITPSMAEVLTGARKYRVGLILAHQELHQLDIERDVASAVLNCGTRVVFKVGDADARTLEKGFSHFEARDLMNLGIGEAVCRVERSDFDFNVAVPNTELPDEDEAMRVRDAVIARARAKYARPRAEVEAELLREFQASPLREAKPSRVSPTTKKAAEQPEPPPPSEEATSSEQAPPPEAESVAPSPSVAPESIATNPTPPRSPPALGRGGATHRDLQLLIQAQAHALGFRADLEEQVPPGNEAVDVGIHRGKFRIACEISVTSRTTPEIGNVLKCLRAGYHHIAFVSSNEKRIEEVSEALRHATSPDEFERIGFYSPDAFLGYLQKFAADHPIQPEVSATPNRLPTKTKRGWTLKSETANLTPEEAKQAEERGLRAIEEALRKKKHEA